MTRLTFSAGAHRYYLADEDGKKRTIRSVTGLLKPIKPDFSQSSVKRVANYAVDHWADLEHKSVSERLALLIAADKAGLNTLAAKGTQVHTWAEDLLSGRPVDVPEEYVAQVRGLADWWDGFTATGGEKIAAESMVWADDDPIAQLIRYAGTFDLLVRHPLYGVALLDIKTGSAPWANQAVQLAGYAAADYMVQGGEDVPMPRCDTLGILRVHPDATTLHLVEGEDMALARRQWQACRHVAYLPDPSFRELVSA